MKKYHCPYCGDCSLGWHKKISLSMEQSAVFGHRHYYCTSCSKRVALKRHKIWWYLFFAALIALPLSLVLSKINLHIAFIMLIIAILLMCAVEVCDLFLSKFVRSEGLKEEFPHKINVDFTPLVKKPKLYFYRTAVLIARIEKENKNFPIRIELVNHYERKGECIFSIIETEKMAIAREKIHVVGKEIMLLDNNELIGVGTVVR